MTAGRNLVPKFLIWLMAAGLAWTLVLLAIWVFAATGPTLILTPADGASVASNTTITCTYSNPPGGRWIDLSIDGEQVFSSPSVPFAAYATQLSTGTHTIACHGWRWDESTNSGVLVGSVENSITVTAQANASPTPGAYPSVTPCSAQWGTGYNCVTPAPGYATPSPSATSAPAGIGPTLSQLTGDGSYLTDPPSSSAIDNCPASIVKAGPLPNDAQAAAMVQPAPKSTVETGSDAQANAAANNYFEFNVVGNPGPYLAQLNQFWSANGCPSSNSVYCRVDGAMPITNATTAMTFQWAAAKWNLDPRLLYSEASIDGDYNILSLGDGGCSVGPMQVAFCNNASHPNHAFTGLPGTTLANENMAFDAEMYAATIYGAYIGQIDSCAQSNIAVSINQWDYGLNTCGTGDWSQQTCSAMASQSWSRFYTGAASLPN